MTAYYNEHDRHAAAWLRELIKEGHIAPGDVDERDIQEVTPDDIRHYTQVHMFAGIGGWSLALRLAAWPDNRPVWTGSCPCQPFSAAGKGKGVNDERHLWPVFAELVRECNPAIVFGEQVASKAGREWLAGVFADLEGMDYQRAGADLCAASVGLPHKRQRLFFVAHSAMYGCERVQRSVATQVQKNRTSKTLGAWHSPGNPFADWKKQLAEARVDRLDDGVSSTVVVRPALRGFGNAIVPQVAATFIEEVMACIAQQEVA